MPSDGTEVEVFVNYGDNYERIRLRNGYSFLPDQKDELLKIIEQEDIMDVKDMNSFGALDVSACVECMLTLFSREAHFKTEMIQRALVCAAMLQRRARQLFLEDNGDDANGDDSTAPLNVFELRVVSSRSQQLVGLLLNTIDQNDDINELKVLQANGDADKVRAGVLEMQFREQLTKRELSKLLADLEE